MTSVPDDPDVRAALAAHAARLKHDLGKYVAMQQRWLGADPEPDALREALRSDLLGTRRGPSGTLDAVEVWRDFRPTLRGEVPVSGDCRVDLSDDPDVRRIESGMEVVARAVADLGRSGLDDLGVAEAHRAALEVSEGCRSLAGRLGAWSRRVDG